MDFVLAHDYLNQRGGAERVVVELMDAYPQAPLYTSIYRPDSTWPQLRGRDIRTSFLQRLPVDEGFRGLFPLYPLAFRSFGELDAGVVLSSSSGWAHAVRTSPRALHVVLCYTPARWLYVPGYASGRLRRLAPAPMLAAARRWDRAAAARADGYIAISRFIAARIAAAYGRKAPVVYPPVEVERFRPGPRGERLLVVSRLLSYKRVDLVVDAATRAGIGLDVVGTGPELPALRAIAGPTVEFHGAADDAVVSEMIGSCRALCSPALEDFGIAAVEAQAAGKPVVAFGAGGALETVEEGVTGAFFTSADGDDVLEAIRHCDAITTEPAVIASHAARFSAAVFRARLGEALERFREQRTERRR